MHHPATRIRKVREQNAFEGIHSRAGHGYKPVALRLPFLVAFLAAFGICIALIERLLADATYSTSSSAGTRISNSRIKRAYTCLNEAAFASQLASAERDYSAVCATFTTTFAPSAANLPAPLQTAFVEWSSAYNAVRSQKASIRAESRSCYLATATTVTPDPVSFITAGCTSSTNPDPTGVCPPIGTLAMVNGSLSSGYYKVTCTQTSDKLLVITTQSTTASTARTTSDTSATTKIQTTITIPASSPVNSKPSTTTNTLPSNNPDSKDSDPLTSSLYDNAIDGPADSTGDGNGPDFTTTTLYTTTAATTDAAGSSLTLTAVVEQTIVLDSSPTSETVVVSGTATASSDGSDTTGNAQVGFKLESHEVMVDGRFTPVSYFGALFFAPILAVVFKAFYEIIHASLKLVEPFHQLRRPVGALATDSMLAQYLSSTISAYAIRAIRTASSLPLWSTIMYFFLEIAAPIASASMSVRSRGMCLLNGINVRCDPAWIINVVAIRFVEAMLALCIALVLLLILFTWDYRLPISGNPSSIASIVGMMNHGPLLNDLAHIDPDASDLEYSLVLLRYRFWLKDHVDPATRQVRLGVVGHKESNFDELLYPQTGQKLQLCRSDDGSINYRPLSTSSHRHSGSVQSLYNTNSAQPIPPVTSSFQRIISNRLLRSFCSDLLCLSTLVTLFAVLIAYYFDNSTSSFNNFFNSQGILAKIILIALATLGDALFKHIERVVRITEPYRRLSLRHARPETTILLPLNGTSWSNIPRCVYYLYKYPDGNMFWQTNVTIVACLGDLNIIAVAGVLFSDAQTHKSLLACMYTSIAFTACMIAITLVTIIWWRRVDIVKEMPRHPSTIATVMSYLCGSAMTREWTGAADAQTGVLFEHMTEEQRRNLIVGSGRRFRFGQFVSPIDERVRWSIDFEGDEVFVVSDKEVFTGGKKDGVSVTVENVSLRVRQRQQVMEWEALRERGSEAQHQRERERQRAAHNKAEQLREQERQMQIENERLRERERQIQVEAEERRDREREFEREKKLRVEMSSRIERVQENEAIAQRQVRFSIQLDMERQYYEDERIRGRLEVP